MSSGATHESVTHNVIMTERRIEYLSLDTVQEAPNNPKEHRTDDIETSINRFGYVSPMVMDGRTNRLVAGHGRLESIRKIRDGGGMPPDGIIIRDGDWHVPVSCGWSSRSDADAAAYLVLDNRQSELGGWDHEALATLLEEIGDPDLIAMTGWDTADLESFLESDADPEPTLIPAADVHESDPGALPTDPVTAPGDIWVIGPHRIICGDVREWGTVEALMDGCTAGLVFTSPPYASQRAYDEASGFTPVRPDAYVDWFEDVQANVRAVLDDDGSWFVNIKAHAADGQRDLYVNDLVAAHVRRWGWLFVDEFCWVNARNGVPGGWGNRFKNAWEPVFHFSKQSKIRFDALANGTETDELFVTSTVRSSSGSGMLGTSAERPYVDGVARPSNVITLASESVVNGHPAVFPIGLPQWFVRAFSCLGDVVFDPFLGSGTTLVAAHVEGRVGFGVEVSPRYCDLACGRLQRITGVVPVRLVGGVAVGHDFCG